MEQAGPVAALADGEPAVAAQPSGAQSENSAHSERGHEDSELDWRTEEDESARLQVYLVTLAAVLAATAERSETPVRTLDDLTREAVRDAVLDAVSNPVVVHPRGGRPVTTVLTALKLVVFMEQPKHFHVALKVTPKTRFLPIKVALRRRSGLASHWSTTHSQWWSAVRYGVFTTEKKAEVDPEPLAWVASGAALNLYEESQEPWNASAVKRSREVAMARAAGEATKSGNNHKAETPTWTSRPWRSQQA